MLDSMIAGTGRALWVAGLMVLAGAAGAQEQPEPMVISVDNQGYGGGGGAAGVYYRGTRGSNGRRCADGLPVEDRTGGGRGPFGGIFWHPTRMEGGYAASASNGDTTRCLAVWPGSGGAGGPHGNYNIQHCFYERGAGGGGGAGGGVIAIKSSEFTLRPGDVLSAKGGRGQSAHGDQGGDACPPGGGSGGWNIPFGPDLIFCMYLPPIGPSGGCGAGGGVLIHAPEVKIESGARISSLACGSTTNGGTVKIFSLLGPHLSIPEGVISAGRLYLGYYAHPIPRVEDFSGPLGWFSGGADGFPEAVSGRDADGLFLTAAESGAFGFWQLPHHDAEPPAMPLREWSGPADITLPSQHLVRVSYQLRGDGPLSSIRLRVADSDQQIAQSIMLPPGHLSPVAEPTVYTQILRTSPRTAWFAPFVDMLPDRTDNAGSTVRIDNVTIEEIPEFAHLQREAVYTFDNGAAGWTFSGAPGWDQPKASKQDGALVLTPTDGAATQLGWWTSPPGTVIDPSRLYIAKFRVSTSAPQTARDRVPTFRLRANETGHRTAAETQVASTWEGALSPAGDEIMEYEVFLHPSGAHGERLTLSLDLLHTNPNDEAHAVRLHEVKVYSTGL